MKTVGLFDAKTRLSEICREILENGEEFTITRRGKAIARILPPIPPKPINPYLEVGIREALAAWDAQWGASEKNEPDFPDIWKERSPGKRNPIRSDRK